MKEGIKLLTEDEKDSLILTQQKVNDGYQMLVCELYKRCAQDYKRAIKTLMKRPTDTKVLSVKHMCERDFLCNKYNLEIDFKKTIEDIRKEVGYVE